MTFLSGAPTRIGLRPKEASHLFMTRVVDRERNKGNRAKVSSEYLLLAQELGLDTSDFRMEVPLAPADREFIEGWIREEGLEGGYAVAIPFTTRPQKHWSEDRWAELLDRVEAELGLPTVILGGPGDVVDCIFEVVDEQVSEATPTRAPTLAPPEQTATAEALVIPTQTTTPTATLTPTLTITPTTTP